MARRDLEPFAISAGRFIVGFDPGMGAGEDCAMTTCERLSDGSVRVIDVQTWNPAIDGIATTRHNQAR